MSSNFAFCKEIVGESIQSAPRFRFSRLSHHFIDSEQSQRKNPRHLNTCAYTNARARNTHVHYPNKQARAGNFSPSSGRVVTPICECPGAATNTSGPLAAVRPFPSRAPPKPRPWAYPHPSGRALWSVGEKACFCCPVGQGVPWSTHPAAESPRPGGRAGGSGNKTSAVGQHRPHNAGGGAVRYMWTMRG